DVGEWQPRGLIDLLELGARLFGRRPGSGSSYAAVEGAHDPMGTDRVSLQSTGLPLREWHPW
ncbi:MAG: hypothetical protein J2P28_24645, partial [Actinobacteria bacterium]|nr:hypothetical protein [Actinomycetota bacterium]